MITDADGKFDSSSLVKEKEVMYNPTTLSYSKNVSWTDAETRGGDIKYKQYDRIGDATLAIDLLFDFTLLPEKDKFEDWFLYFKALSSETIKSDDEKKTKRPPILSISWGSSHHVHFTSCVITSLNWKYDLFDKEGDIIRATASITFQEVNIDKKTEWAKVKKFEFPKETEMEQPKADKKKDDVKKDDVKKEDVKKDDVKKDATEEMAKAKDEALGKVEEAKEEATNQVSEVKDSAVNLVTEATEKASQTMEEAKTVATQMVEEAKTAATESVDKAKAAVEETISKAEEAAAEAVDKAKAAAEETINKVETAAADTIAKAEDAAAKQ